MQTPKRVLESISGLTEKQMRDNGNEVYETILAAMEAYAAQSPHPVEGQTVYRWVNGNDRLPEQTWQGVVRWTDNAAWAVMSEFGFCDGNIYDYGKVFDSQPLEWLEPITLPLPVGGE